MAGALVSPLNVHRSRGATAAVGGAPLLAHQAPAWQLRHMYEEPLPVTLDGTHVRLEPLTLEHLPALVDVGLDPSLWAWTVSAVASEAQMRDYVEDALAQQQRGAALPFATIHRESGRVVGSTRYGNIDRWNRRMEIGWTWVAPPWQRTPINTEAKYLMLRHAFERLGCVRVELKTDVLNDRSRRAIRRIGAVEEGVLRQHMLTGSGRWRDTVYYSVLDREWPAVRKALEGMLAR